MTAYKFQVEFSYDPTRNGLQDSVVMSAIRNFTPDLIGVEKGEDYRCVTLGTNENIVNGVSLLNALQDATRQVDKKNVKLSAIVYSIGQSIDFNSSNLTSENKATINAMKPDESVADLVKFNDGLGFHFKNLKDYQEFEKTNKDSIEALKASGVKVEVGTLRNELYDVSNYTSEKNTRPAFN